MTRILSDILQATEPAFRLHLHQLERLQGHPNTDIKLSVEVVQAAQQSLHALGLDRHDTTPQELYQAIVSRLHQDDVRLERALRTRAAHHVSAEALLNDGLLHAVRAQAARHSVMALKPVVLKRLLKQHPPKRLQKALKYRSTDAMLRQESTVSLLACGRIIETAAWSKALIDSYKKLRPADFENRPIQVLQPTAARWQPVMATVSDARAHTIFAVFEMGAIMVAPLPIQRRLGMVVATAALAIQELNKLGSVATYIRASQVEADFGHRIVAISQDEVMIPAPTLPQALPWQLIQQYVATTSQQLHEDIFGPYVKATDFYWHSVEATLADWCPALEFWRHSSHLSFQSAGQAVSLNIIDAAINSCNRVAFSARSNFYAKQALWAELSLRYLDKPSVEQSVAVALHPKFAFETA